MDTGYRTSKTSPVNLALTLFTPKPAVTVMGKGKCTPFEAKKPSADKYRSFVEFETATDLKTAVEKLDGREFKGVRVTCVADVCIGLFLYLHFY